MGGREHVEAQISRLLDRAEAVRVPAVICTEDRNSGDKKYAWTASVICSQRFRGFLAITLDSASTIPALSRPARELKTLRQAQREESNDEINLAYETYLSDPPTALDFMR